MAVPEQTPYKEYDGNGVTKTFPLEFLCKKKEHLIVRINDEDVPASDWSFGNEAVTFNTAPESGSKITLQRRTPNKRATNFQSFNNSFNPITLNEDLDTLWQRMQEEDVAKFLLHQLINMNYEDLDEKGRNIRTELIERLTTQANQFDQDLTNKTNQLDQKIQNTAIQLNNQIYQQGLTQQQLQSYYSFLLNQMANLSSNKNWLASLIADASGENQQDINDKQKTKNLELKTLSDFGDDLSLVFSQSNAVISGGMKTISLTNVISKTGVNNLTVKDAIIDCSGITNSSGNAKRIISFSGSEGTSKYATQDAPYNQNKFYCNTSGLAKGDLVFIQSEMILTSINVRPCQYSRIVQVNTDHVVLDTDTLYPYLVTDNARLYKVIPCNGIKFSNVKFVGAQTGLQNALFLDKCEDCHIDVTINQIDYAGVEVRQSLNCTITGTYRDAQAAGLAYGVAIMNGCQNVRVIDSFGEDLRHHVTQGGTLINNFCGGKLNHAKNCRDAGYDSHPASNGAFYTENIVECTRGDLQPKDGIIMQGLNSVIKDNQVIGAYVHSIVVESYVKQGFKNSATIHDNICLNSGSPSSATSANIHIFAKEGDFDSVSVQLNEADGGMEFGIYAQTGLGDINNLSILNNPKLKSSLYNIFLDARAGKKITGFGIKDNTTFEGGVDIMCQGVGKNISDGVISNNRLRGGSNYNIRLIDCDDIEEYNNKCSSASTRRLQVETSTNINPATNNTAIRTATASNISTTVEDYYIVVNRPSGPSNLLLYDASQYKSRVLILKNKTAQSIVSSTPIEQLDGTMSTAVITGPGVVTLKSDGANWFIA